MEKKILNYIIHRHTHTHMHMHTHYIHWQIASKNAIYPLQRETYMCIYTHITHIIYVYTIVNIYVCVFLEKYAGKYILRKV